MSADTISPLDDPVFAIEGDLTNLDLVSEDACEPQPEDTISNPEPETRMRLSSKHLTLASRYFKTMLTAPWKETLTQAGQQQHAISAEGWDAEALLVLMRIIHGRTQGVPRVVTLDMMAKFAVLVDYYDCHEVVDCVVS